MAYTIVKSDGTFLTTIADGTMDVTHTSLGLPGRNYAGYGQPVDTNFVHMIENFAKATVPANPLRGQLWFDTSNEVMKVCTADGDSNAATWLSLASTLDGGTQTFGALTVIGEIDANNASISNLLSAGRIEVGNIDITGWANIANANITYADINTANIGTLNTRVITTGGTSITGEITGQWEFNGIPTAIFANTGNIVISNVGNVYGIKTDKYMWANGAAWVPTGTYTNGNVFDYLTGSNAISQFSGNIAPANVTSTGNVSGAAVITPIITTGANVTPGTITGTWTLTTGSKLQATYADLAERFEADAIYEAGTVVEIGGEKEITAVVDDLSNSVFGVVSSSAAYLMNATAGNDETHPAIALSGRLLVNVVGSISKGDRLVSAGTGRARAAKPGEATAFNSIGRSLADKIDVGTGTIEAIVNIR